MKQIVAVASGKGGVGKSTIAANLAVALAQSGAYGNPNASRIALIDVDFYGPSIPTLMGGGEIHPNQAGQIVPAQRYGVKYMSIAFFLKNPDDPIVWRGPMFAKAISQLFTDVDWGDIDICIVDLPPGTGDAQLSLSQQIQLSGALMVTTPQEVALADVRRAVQMFAKVNVPVLGVIENMAGFTTASGERVEIFGSGGGQALAAQYELPFLGSLPIDLELRKGGDEGVPAAFQAGSQSSALFSELAGRLPQLLASSAQPALKIVN